MKRSLMIVAALLLLVASQAFAQAPKFGIGVAGGVNIPIAQDDQASGSTFNVLARIKVGSFLVAEPNIMFGKWGAPGEVSGVDMGIDGSKITAFGVDFTLGGLPGGVGFKPYAVLGVASYKVKNEETFYDQSKIGWSGGLGFGIAVTPMVDLDVRTRAIVMPQEEGSKKALTVTGGLTYYFGMGM